ncbi:MAG: glucokinase [Actinomycetota bacterium]|nr:glucokinase [Actinomycetota bacterium]
MTGLALALDIGATKIAGCLVDARGVVTEHRHAATQDVRRSGASPYADEIWAVIARMVGELWAAAGGRVIGLGIGSAGPLDLVHGTASPVNIPQWRQFPVVERVSELLPGVPVHLAGDGICAAAGEHWRGGGADSQDMIAILVSTGIGGRLVQGGRLIAGPTGNAGHVGHVIVDLNGALCGCGARGCVESMASGPSMVTWALANGWTPPSSVATAVSLANDARTGNATVIAAFARSGRVLAAGIASVGAMCDLTDAVVGGGVGHAAADLLFPPLRTSLREYGSLPFLRRPAIRSAELGPRAGLLGAAAMVFDPETYQL